MSENSDLASILDLEVLEHNLFRGAVPQVGWTRVFGGLVIAQALGAACRTVPGLLPHSLHCYFLLGGDPAIPIVYDVDRIRDGGSFATRRVVAIQHGRSIFAISVSFHKQEPGFEHQAAMPDVPLPEALPDEAMLARDIYPRLPPAARRYFERQRLVELRPVDFERYFGEKSGPARGYYWMRVRQKLSDDPAEHRCLLAYASDLTLLDVALSPHGQSVFSPELMTASLDHALWFHRDFRADEWLLYAQDSPSAAAGRGFSRGQIFSREGALVASVAQEGLLRPRRKPAG